MGASNSKQSKPNPRCKSTEQEQEEKDIVDWLKRSKEIKLMVSGKTGVGKSTLLNGIIGEKVFGEGDDYDPTTLEVEARQARKADVDILVFDTPGLQDGSGNEQKYLDSMKEKCKDIHLLLYCISMAEVRCDLRDENSAIKKITKTLGPDVWKNAIIVLTFANTYESRLLDDGLTEKQVKANFKVRMSEWEEKVRESLRESDVPNEIAKDVHAIPASFRKQPHLISQNYWLSHFWTESVLTMKEEAQAAMVKMSLHRFKREKDIKPEDFDKKIEDQPIVFKMLDKALAGGAATAGAAGGATTGALIGALAIGIPTFGVAAGVGLLLGAIVGGGIGGGGGAGVGLLIALYRRKKKKSKMIKLKKEALDQLARDLASQ